MKKIDVILSDYINMIGGQNLSRTEKIDKLIDQITGDGNKIKIGGNKKVIILEESADKKWQKIRIPDTDKEGWVKSGNIQRSQ